AEQVDDDQVAEPQPGLAAAPQIPQQPLLDRMANLRDNRGHGNSLLGARGPGVLASGNSHFLVYSPIPPAPGLQLIRARSFRCWARLPPSISFMLKKCRPACSPTS